MQSVRNTQEYKCFAREQKMFLLLESVRWWMWSGALLSFTISLVHMEIPKKNWLCLFVLLQCSQAICLGFDRQKKHSLLHSYIFPCLPAISWSQGSHLVNTPEILKILESFPHCPVILVGSTGRRIAQSAGGSPLPNQGRTLKAETTGSQGRVFL